ncbi:FecR family protein [Neptuniibacter pectenicola]|uniref:FecR family protein n=1 Tax=Neptuniibacter pectenicola TaxID=1806669 RepID=UPI0030EC70A7
MARLPRLLMFTAVLFMTAIGASPSMAAAQEAAAVVLSIGKNTAQLPQQPSRDLKRKSSIYTQDLISTGPKGQLQLRFSDGSRFSLREKTVFSVETYQFNKDTPETGNSVYRLLKGGLRTITGAISHTNVEHYQVHTPIASIGVRGTHYTLFYCDSVCEKDTQATLGLYGYVLEGEIVVKNDAVSAPVSAGRYFFLDNSGRRLQIKKTPFDIFETVKDLGPVLLNGIDAGSVPATEVLNARELAPEYQ